MKGDMVPCPICKAADDARAEIDRLRRALTALADQYDAWNKELSARAEHYIASATQYRLSDKADAYAGAARRLREILRGGQP
jgi:hypothetical protein